MAEDLSKKLEIMMNHHTDELKDNLSDKAEDLRANMNQKADELKANVNAKTEEFKVKGEEILTKVKEVVAEGSVRRIIINNKESEVIMEIPLAIGLVGAVMAPIFAAVGAIAALAMECTIVVEHREKHEK
jgi:predicted O-methyltransferase YrrM